MFRPIVGAIALVLALPVATATAQERLQDPTERTSVNAREGGGGANPQWMLESTLVSADRRFAVINGETVTVGDRVRGARVMQIDVYAVRLRTADGMVELTLSGTDPKRVTGGGAR
ncbi:MAG: hypothetical protein LC632_07005 [Xanthomonadaceae bacterium]|nr:hypothetical protein [Xanthomonadaceae bacterium]